jgi:aldose sugar dehydrogenase
MAFIVSFILISTIIISTMSTWGNASYGDLSGPRPTHEEPIIHDNSLEPETIFKGEGFFTSMDFVGPNDILVLDKNNGRVHRIVNGSFLDEPLLDVNVANMNERGMLGIAVAKRSNEDDYSLGIGGKDQKTYVFLFYSASTAEDGEDEDELEDLLGNRLYRYELVQNRLTDPKLLLDLKPDPRTVHNGGTTVIGPDNNVYVVTGEAGNPKTLSRNIKDGLDPFGSSGILKLTQDGRPLVNINGSGILGTTYPLTTYYAYGIRNSFGMDFDPVTGNLWDTENGPYYGDEINLVEPGFNSGWNYVHGFWAQDEGYASGTILNLNEHLVDFDGRGKYSSPEFTWLHSGIGVTALRFLDSDKLGKQYKNDVFVGDWINGRLYHFDLDEHRRKLDLKGPLGDKISNSPEELQNITFGEGFGGITDIDVGPDGYLYILSVRFIQDNCEDYDSEDEDDNCSNWEGTISRVKRAENNISNH